jgi:hypothetical protein
MQSMDSIKNESYDAIPDAWAVDVNGSDRNSAIEDCLTVCSAISKADAEGRFGHEAPSGGSGPDAIGAGYSSSSLDAPNFNSASCYGLLVGDRVDCMDVQGGWFPGSIADIVTITSDDKAAAATATAAAAYEDEAKKGGRSIAFSPYGKKKSSSKNPPSPGVYAKVHFDRVSDRYDKLVGYKDFKLGRVAPIYSQCTRKTETILVSGMHRVRISEGRWMEQGLPFVVHASSAHSCAKVHTIVCDQALRYAAEAVDGSPRGLEALSRTFIVRMVPKSHPLIEERPKKPEDSWAGSSFPKDSSRPFVNLYHDQMVISVDWDTSSTDEAEIAVDSNTTTTPFVAAAVVNGLSFVDARAAERIAAKSKEKEKGRQLTDCFDIFTQGKNIEDWTCEFCGQRTLSQIGDAFGGGKEPKATGDLVGDSGDLNASGLESESDAEPEPETEPPQPTGGLVKTMMSRAPDVLVVHLKRFSMEGIYGAKISTVIDFPLRGLDMSAYVHSSALGGGDPTRMVYDLYGIVNHAGGLGSGHYTAFVLADHPPPVNPANTALYPEDPCVACLCGLECPFHHTNTTPSEAAEMAENAGMGVAVPQDVTTSAGPQWYYCDDASVRLVSDPANVMVSSAAYVLFYRRRLLRSSNIVDSVFK